jgi:hypothetical protein
MAKQRRPLKKMSRMNERIQSQETADMIKASEQRRIQSHDLQKNIAK